jgi:hypothetical protein
MTAFCLCSVFQGLRITALRTNHTLYVSTVERVSGVIHKYSKDVQTVRQRLYQYTEPIQM